MAHTATKQIKIEYYLRGELVHTTNTTDDWDASERALWNEWLNDPSVSHEVEGKAWDEFELKPY